MSDGGRRAKAKAQKLGAEQLTAKMMYEQGRAAGLEEAAAKASIYDMASGEVIAADIRALKEKP